MTWSDVKRALLLTHMCVSSCRKDLVPWHYVIGKEPYFSHTCGWFPIKKKKKKQFRAVTLSDMDKSLIAHTPIHVTHLTESCHIWMSRVSHTWSWVVIERFCAVTLSDMKWGLISCLISCRRLYSTCDTNVWHEWNGGSFHVSFHVG